MVKRQIRRKKSTSQVLSKATLHRPEALFFVTKLGRVIRKIVKLQLAMMIEYSVTLIAIMSVPPIVAKCPPEEKTEVRQTSKAMRSSTIDLDLSLRMSQHNHHQCF